MPPVTWVDYYPWTGMVSVSVFFFFQIPIPLLLQMKSVYTKHKHFCGIVHIVKRKLQSHICNILPSFFLPLLMICVLKEHKFLASCSLPFESSCNSEVLRYEMFFSSFLPSSIPVYKEQYTHSNKLRMQGQPQLCLSWPLK